MNHHIKFGTCGWSHESWRGLFYPESLPKSEWLAFYARIFSAVEIDSTFYSAPNPATVGDWLETTPEEFSFTCKMPRMITHRHRLRECKELVNVFLESLAPLRPKLGPILIQLPLSFRPDPDEVALKEFLFKLPRDFSFAVEFRNADWHLPRIVKFFEDENICWVWSDTSTLAVQNRPPFEFLPQTADCLYIRLIGDLKRRLQTDQLRHHGFLPSMRDAPLESWAIKIEKHLSDSHCAYLFADNHYEGYSVRTTHRIAQYFDKQFPLPPIAHLAEDQKNHEQLDLL